MALNPHTRDDTSQPENEKKKILPQKFWSTATNNKKKSNKRAKYDNELKTNGKYAAIHTQTHTHPHIQLVGT